MSGHKAKLTETQVLRIFESQKDVTTAELANYLQSDLSAATWWRQTLTERGAIEYSGDRPAKAMGRPSKAYRLVPEKSRRAVPDKVRLGDRVITPSNRVAVVVDAEDDGRLDLEYLGEPGEQLQGATIVMLPPALCVVWRKDAPRPEPVRVRG